MQSSTTRNRICQRLCSSGTCQGTDSLAPAVKNYRCAQASTPLCRTALIWSRDSFADAFLQKITPLTYAATRRRHQIQETQLQASILSRQNLATAQTHQQARCRASCENAETRESDHPDTTAAACEGVVTPAVNHSTSYRTSRVRPSTRDTLDSNPEHGREQEGVDWLWKCC